MEAPNEIELDLKATQRKLNLLCSWIHLKFGQDPTFPQALLPSSSFDNDIEIKEEEGGRPLFEPNIMQAPLNVEENTTSEPIQHRCGICSAPFSSSQALTLHKTSHCSVKLTRIDNELHARKSKRKSKLTVRQFFASDFQTWSSGEEEAEAETIIPDIDSDYEPPPAAIEESQIACFTRSNSKPSGQGETSSVTSVTCPICSKIFQTRKDYFHHKYSVHSKQLQKVRTGIISSCPECEMKLASYSALVIHVRTVHPDSNIKVEKPSLSKISCSICRKTFFSKSNFKKHMRQTHNSDIPQELEKKLTEKERENHIFRNTWCHKCEKGFEKCYQLRTHLEQIHPDDEIEESAFTSCTSSKRKFPNTCPFCPEKFSSREDYFHHKYNAHSNRPQKVRTGIISSCPECKITLASNRALVIHIREEHPGSNIKVEKTRLSKISCSICNRIFFSRSNFETHLRQAHNSEIPQELEKKLTEMERENYIFRNAWCHKCEKGFEKCYQLKTHLKQIHPDDQTQESKSTANTRSFERKYLNRCPFCSEKFATRQDYFRHKFSVHRDRLKPKRRIGIVSTCPACGIKLASFRALEAHVKDEHPDSNVKLDKKFNFKITCSFCKKLFLSFPNFRTHLRQEHNSEVPPELKDRIENEKEGHILRNSWCHKCEIGFERSNQLITHIKKLHPDEYEAKQAEYITMAEKNKPAKPIADNERLQPVNCEECGVTVRKSWLRMHMKLHGEKCYVCEFCSYSTHRRDGLRQHLETHSEERRYKCTFCPYAAKQKPGIDNHMRSIHGSEDTKIQCELCGQFFKLQKNLAKHLKAVHHNIRPHSCNLCDKSFKSKTHLKYHIGTHSNPNGRKRGLNKEREPIVRRAPPTVKRTSSTSVNMKQLSHSEVTSTNSTTVTTNDVEMSEPRRQECMSLSSVIGHDQTQISTSFEECKTLFSSSSWYANN